MTAVLSHWVKTNAQANNANVNVDDAVVLMPLPVIDPLIYFIQLDRP